MILNIIIIILGLVASILLFYKFPFLKTIEQETQSYKLSVIIPARNEEKVLSYLLEGLKKQSYPIFEIICIDDCSTDQTAQIAQAYGVKVISLKEKPANWTGKAWACQKGAEAASGELFLFLDADVRFNKDALKCIVDQYSKSKCVISVLPYHKTIEPYEKLSFFFNIIQAGANGVTAAKNVGNAGLFGPVILINKSEYETIGGHSSVKNSIVDDIALGERLTKSGKKFKLMLGGDKTEYRMYSSGFISLFRGWLKNFSTGAIKTPLLLLVAVFLWISSCLSTAISLSQSLYLKETLNIILFAFFYIIWAAELYRISVKLGNFSFWQAIFYPLYMVFFVFLFFLSLLKKVFRQKVVWKDRKIKLEK